MPSLKDIEVHVTDQEGRPLEEYGVQKITKANLVSCFIESKSDKPFRVTVKPTTLPFPGFSSTSTDKEGEMTHDDENNHDDGDASPKAEPQGRKAPVPFHLLATMRLDGREKYEKQVIVYLDENHPSYAYRTWGTVTFRTRLMYDEEGKMCHVGWVFKEVGVDDLFSDLFGAMGIGGGEDGEAVPLTAEDELAEAFTKLGEGKLQDKQESRAGQIEISLERIVVKETRRGAWKPSEDLSKDEGGAKSDLKDIAHRVGRDRAEGVVPAVDAIFYEPWPQADQRKYATFLFYYRSAETLSRFGFPGFATGAQAPKATRKGELAASKLASSVGVGEKARRAREEDEEAEGPVKEGRWGMQVAVRGARVEDDEEVAAGDGKRKKVEEDEAL